MKKIFTLAVTSLLLAGALCAGLLLPKEVLLQSLESKTLSGQPVFNRISYLESKGREIWMMNQSHLGFTASPSNWDRLAIVIENQQADFLQLPPGPLEWSEELLQQRLPYKVSCFFCHSNGPRLIRPDSVMALDWKSQFKVGWWNLKIKFSQRVSESENQRINDQNLKVPFRHRGGFENQALHLAACTECHNEDDSRGKGLLIRQNALAIDFMIQNKLMPPGGEKLTNLDKKFLSDFINGF